LAGPRTVNQMPTDDTKRLCGDHREEEGEQHQTERCKNPYTESATKREAVSGGVVQTWHRDDRGNVLKIRPPLLFVTEHADRLVETLNEVLSAR
jgi:4-aminobutyrate aminotransferase-like enzyme